MNVARQDANGHSSMCSREEWLAKNNPKPRDDGLTASDAERWVVGSMLVDPACVPRLLSIVQARDFSDAELREAFAVIVRRHRAGDPIDVALVLEDLKASPKVSNARTLLVSIAEDIHTAAHGERYAQIVAGASLKRRILDVALAAADGTRNGHDGEEVLSELHSFCEDELRGRTGGVSQRVAIGDLVRDYPSLRPPVVDGLFREGETVNIIAPPKARKSWLVYALALRIVTGGYVFERFSATAGRVLLIDNELHPETIADRIPKVAAAMGLEARDYERGLDVIKLRGNLRSLEQLQTGLSDVVPGDYSAIVLDAKYRFSDPTKSENDNAAEAQVYNLIDQLAADTGAAVILVHHTAKGSQADKAVTDVGAGAGAQSRAADCHVILRPHEEDDCVVLDAALRSFPPIEPLALRWAFPAWIPADELDPSRLERTRTRRQVDQERRDADGRQQVAKALQDEPEGLSKSRLEDATGISRERLKRLLHQLSEDGEVIRETTRIKGNTCDVYRLAG